VRAAKEEHKAVFGRRTLGAKKEEEPRGSQKREANHLGPISLEGESSAGGKEKGPGSLTGKVTAE